MIYQIYYYPKDHPFGKGYLIEFRRNTYKGSMLEEILYAVYPEKINKKKINDINKKNAYASNHKSIIHKELDKSTSFSKENMLSISLYISYLILQNLLYVLFSLCVECIISKFKYERLK